jgi:hypothetical protein
MDSDIYMEIIEENLVPFGQEVFGGYYFLHQDNSPIHTSEECRAQIQRERIRWVKNVWITASISFLIFS